MIDTTNNQTAASKAPSHIAFNVTELEGGKRDWKEVGLVWAHADGKGFTLVKGEERIILRVPSKKTK